MNKKCVSLINKITAFNKKFIHLIERFIDHLFIYYFESFFRINITMETSEPIIFNHFGTLNNKEIKSSNNKTKTNTPMQ